MNQHDQTNTTGMNRRGFLKSLFAGAVVAAIPLSALRTVAPELFQLRGDGVTDDSAAFQALIDGKPVLAPDGQLITAEPGLNEWKTIYIPAGTYYLGDSRNLIHKISMRGA